jgi:ribonucleoside-triphosphate reductase
MLLDEAFLAPYRGEKPLFGFASGPNSLGELTWRRTYRRGKETPVDNFARCVNGVYEILLGHAERYSLPFDEKLARYDARQMFDRLYHFKWTPPGRGLWIMGTDFVRQRGGMALHNCAFVSTKNIGTEFDKPFRFLMDVSMLGVGCGFDTRGKGKADWCPEAARKPYAIPDSREGWVDSTGELLRWGFGQCAEPVFDYSRIRKKGSPIKGFGGVCEGPDDLRKLHEAIRSLILRRAGQPVSGRDIADIMNLIGVCVISGNVRRVAEICFGEADDDEFLGLKDYERNPDRAAFGWTSNNSVFARVGMNYAKPAERTAANGEPGYAWLENMRAFSRMKDRPDYKDQRVDGTNPCGEQSLESYETCCLVETYPTKHESLDDYKKTLKYAYLYAKAVTLLPTHWKETNAVQLRNRRIGCSMSGVAQFVARKGQDALIGWCEEGYQTVRHYDRVYSEWLAVRESVKVSSIKPSGTVSLLANATPGAHYPTFSCYIRRVRFSASHADLPAIAAAGYPVEDSIVGHAEDGRPIYDPSTKVVEFPVMGDPDVPTEKDVSLRDKVKLAVLLQRYWADNQVSYTATFRPDEADQIAPLLSEFDRQLKSISFLPMVDGGAYPQMPYEAITVEEYERRAAHLKPIVWPDKDSHDQDEKYCDGQACEVKA